MSTDIAAVAIETLSGSSGDLDVAAVAAETLSGSTGALDVAAVSVEVLSGDLVNFFGIAGVAVEVLSGDLPDPTSAANKRPTITELQTGSQVSGSGPQGQQYTGQTFRISWAGRVYEWEGLRLPVSETLDIWSGTPGDRSISLSLQFPDSVPTLISQGNRLTDAFGQLFDSSGQLLLAGTLEAPTWRQADRRVAFTIRESIGKERATFPPNYTVSLIVTDEQATQKARDTFVELLTRSAIIAGHPQSEITIEGDQFKIPGVSPITLPTIYASTAVGRTYPFVFGRPGFYSGDSGISFRIYKGSRALYIDTVDKILLIAGHEVSATDVVIWGKTGDVWAPLQFAVEKRTDQVGRVISVVDISGATYTDWLTTDPQEIEQLEFYVSWAYGDALSGKAGDVIETLLATSTIRVDWDRTRQAREQLNRFELAAVIDEPVSVFEWLTQQLACLGVSWVSGPDGIYPWIYDPDAGPTHRLTSARGVALAGDIEYSDVETVNRVSMRYRYDELKADFAAITSPEAAQAGIGRRLYGEQALTIEAEVIQDDEIANLAAMRKLTLFSSIPYIVPVTIPRGEYDLKVGDLCTLTLDDVGLIARRVLVSEITTDGGPFLEVTLTAFNDPITEPHTP